MNAIRVWIARILDCLLVTLLVACNAPVNVPVEATQSLPAIVQSTPTEQAFPTPSVTPTKTLINTPTHTRTSKPTDTPTNTPTNTPTSTPTSTPLPPLPDFEQVLAFALGGGGACEIGPNQKVPNIRVFVSPGYGAFICFRDAFSLHQIDWYAPDGRILTSMIDNPSIGEYFFSWPLSLPSGEWRLHAYGDGSSEDVDFSVPPENISSPYIAAIDPRSDHEINHPYSMPLKQNGNLDVIGLNYPANQPVYILVYHNSSTSNEYQLIHKRSVLSDPDGSLATELSGLFKVGDSYLVIGISDPTVSLVSADYDFFNTDLPFDNFQVLPSTFASSCPGAPQQRMIVDQRGYVCTQSDSVRLREAPARSAKVLTQLPTGSQFTVTGGPACADNWSWWQIQTDSGHTGWISEGGGDPIDPYFICPIP